MAIVIFCQGMGGAVFLIVANAVFSNSIRRLLQQQLSSIGVAPEIILNAGARGLRHVVLAEDQLAVVLKIYSDSVDNVMYLGIAVSCVAFAFAWGLGWKDIRVEKHLSTLEGNKPSPRKTSVVKADLIDQTRE